MAIKICKCEAMCSEQHVQEPKQHAMCKESSMLRPALVKNSGYIMHPESECTLCACSGRYDRALRGFYCRREPHSPSGPESQIDTTSYKCLKVHTDIHVSAQLICHYVP